jgi:RNA polymerase sigma factor (TIGR02999 family)
METEPGQVTRMLEAVGDGNPQAVERLFPLVYEKLRALAHAKLRRLAPGQTLQATALVHEVWLRVVGDDNPPIWKNRSHFFAVAAEAMRRVLVENARRKSAEKRGGGVRPLDLHDVSIAEETRSDVLLAVDEALERLAARDPLAAQLIKLRFFVGMPNAQAAETLGVPERTAKRTWTYARAWLYNEINKSR